LKKRVYWSIADEASIDCRTSYLSKAEQSIFDGFRFDLRRDSFLAGRWVAKRLIQNVLLPDKSFCEISILNESSGKPYAVYDGERLDGELSISHAGKWAAAALSVDGLSVGVDIEVTTPRSSAFVVDYFSSGECALLNDRTDKYDLNVTVIWSAKESMLKALGLGLRLDTRRVRVTSIGFHRGSGSDGWNPLGLESDNSVWVGCWRQINEVVLVCAICLTHPCEIELLKV
jgi:phosphopantetheinyl transferase